MPDISKLHNPYDFANPVSDADLFVGRESELEEINYYLDQAIAAPNPINIAMLGKRAAGKTSLLNMCDIEAKKRGFCTVRIDLDEGDAKTQLGFFYKLFDSLFQAACKFGAFGGKKGKTFDTYLDIVTTYKIPDEKTFCPFVFPIQYAKAFGSENYNVQLSDNLFKMDLVEVQSEVNKPIILLFDEVNVLSGNRIYLEKLRNIFMNIRGYMLVFIGTPDLFPVMDEIFSPIVRQFKKINVGEFEDKEDTKECIRKPLVALDIKPEEIFDFETYRDVSEIHNISGGRPYEIQLICHVLFRRVQTKRAKKMKLDVSVLEDVLRELETSQDIRGRPILTKIKSLNKEQLSALRLLCICNEYATFDHIWAIEYIFKGKKARQKEDLKKDFQYFVDEGILETRDNIINFAGDDFDKIYTKYFSRERKVSLDIQGYPLEVFLGIVLAKIIGKIKGMESLKDNVAVYSSGTREEICTVAKEMSGVTSKKDVFAESNPQIMKTLYHLMLNYRNKEKVPIILVEFVSPWLNALFWYYCENPNDISSITKCLHKIEDLKKRSKEVGVDLKVDEIKLPVVSIEILADQIEHTENENFRNYIANTHNKKMVDEYTLEKNTEEAAFHADLSYRYNPNPKYWCSNNLGYVFMSTGHLDKARELFGKSISTTSEDSSPTYPALPYYNLGILEAKCGNIKNAFKNVELCLKKMETVEIKDGECACLFIPETINGELKFKEINRPDILISAQKAKKQFENFL